MEVQDYTSLVAALNTVDELAKQSIEKSKATTSEIGEDVWAQMIFYLAETLTPLIDNKAFIGKELVSSCLSYISIDIGNYQNGSKMVRAGRLLVYSSIPHPVCVYFMSDGTIAQNKDAATPYVIALAKRWPEVKTSIKSHVSAISAEFARIYKERVNNAIAEEGLLKSFEI